MLNVVADKVGGETVQRCGEASAAKSAGVVGDSQGSGGSTGRDSAGAGLG